MATTGGFGAGSRREKEIRQIMSPKRPSSATPTGKERREMAAGNKPITPASRDRRAQQIERTSVPPARTGQFAGLPAGTPLPTQGAAPPLPGGGGGGIGNKDRKSVV